MKLYAWCFRCDDEPKYVYWSGTRSRTDAADERRMDSKRPGWHIGPLVTVDLPEPGTTKGKRRGKK